MYYLTELDPRGAMGLGGKDEMSVGGVGSYITAIDYKTGKTVWGGDIRPLGDGSAAITCVGGQIIFRYQDGTLALIEANPKAYTFHGQFKPEYQERESWSHPVVVNGKMYLREQDKLMCYDVAG